MALKIVTSSGQHSLTEMMIEEIRLSGDVQGCTVLVPTRAAADGLRRLLQHELQDFAPPVHTLEAWIDSLALLSIDSRRRPKMVLNPAERLLAFEFFLQTSGEGNRGFASQKALKAGASIAGDLQRAGRNLADLLTEAEKEERLREPRFARKLAEFGSWLEEKGWYNREAVPALLEKPGQGLLPRKMLVFFEIDYLFETQKMALAPVIRALLDDENRDVTAYQTVETRFAEVNAEALNPAGTGQAGRTGKQAGPGRGPATNPGRDPSAAPGKSSPAGRGSDKPAYPGLFAGTAGRAEQKIPGTGRIASGTYVGPWLNWLLAQSPHAEIIGSMASQDKPYRLFGERLQNQPTENAGFRMAMAEAVVDGSMIDPDIRAAVMPGSQKELQKGMLHGSQEDQHGSEPGLQPDLQPGLQPDWQQGLPPAGSIAMIICHDERAEIENALRTIAMEIALTDEGQDKGQIKGLDLAGLPESDGAARPDGGPAERDTRNPAGRTAVTGKRKTPGEPAISGKNIAGESAIGGKMYSPVDPESSRRKAPYCSDYVIMTGNTNRYRPLVKALAEKYGLPVSIHPADPLISNPVVRRFIRLLELDQLDFSIDAIYEIFADNLFSLPGLIRNDEEKAPNIRSFTQFCRKFNIRTLDEADDRIRAVHEEVRKKSGEPVPDGFDREKTERERARALREMDYYDEVVGLLLKYRSSGFRLKKEPLSVWADWAVKMAEAQKSPGPARAGTSRKQFLDMLRKLKETYQRLGLDPLLEAAQFLRIVRLTAGEQREKSDRYPNGVLFCDLSHYPLTNGKKVFITGLHESGLVTSENMDFLRFRYHKELGRLLYDNKPDAYLKARFHLLRQILNAERVTLSRPLHSGDQKVIGSVIWQDLLQSIGLGEKDLSLTAAAGTGTMTPASQMSGYSAAGKAPEDVIWCLDAHELDTLRSQSIIHGAEHHYIHDKNDHAGLLAAICNDRENPLRTGAWDGVLNAFEHPGLKLRAEANIRRWWDRQTRTNGNLQLSISRLDEYAASPLDYFFNRVLRLQPLEEYRDDAESNVKGLIVHSILQHFYTPVSPFTNVEMARPADDPDKARKRIGQITEQVLNEFRNQLGYSESPFPELLRANIRNLVRWFLDVEVNVNHALNEDGYLPASFIPGSGLGMEYRWDFTKTWNGVGVIMNGYIDRIDIHPGKRKAVVYDYKSGSNVKQFSDIRDGLSFQLPLYFMALAEKGYTTLGGAYYKVPIGKKAADIEIDYRFGSEEVLGKYRDNLHPGNRKREGIMADDEVAAVLSAVGSRVGWIVGAMQNGTFNQSLTGRSAWSDYNGINRYNLNVQKLREKSERKEAALAGAIPHRYYLAGSGSPDENDEEGGRDGKKE